jgi:aspartyl-tRNA(Asn)/glutamyl-tRNA(Gln) amidotransferase subunit A
MSETPRAIPPAWDPATPEPLHAERALARFAAEGAWEAPATDLAPPEMLEGIAAIIDAFSMATLSPVDLLTRLHERIVGSPTGREAVLAFIPDAEDAAHDSAWRWREGRARPLEGIPFGVKDIIDVQGARVTCGSLLTEERIATRDAAVVARLRAAGAIPFVMLATTEFACGSPHNPRYGAVKNPYDPARWTGGSSTGSGAALAARLVPFALGSDTGGSIRVPSAWCGITGLKPTRGLVPRSGVAPLSWTLDHVGPMACFAADLATIMPVIAGVDDEDLSSGGAFHATRLNGFSGLRIGVPTRWFEEVCDAAVREAWRHALDLMQSEGARLVEVDPGDVASAHADGWTVLLSELASMQDPAFDRIDMFDAGARKRILQGRDIPAREYLNALRRRPAAIAALAEAMADVDVLATPGLGGEAGFLETLDVDVDGARVAFQDVISRNTMLFDYTGFPALMLPTGAGRDGLPVAMQIVGKPFEDGLCLAVGEAFQALTEHHRRAPEGVEAAFV